MMNSFLRANNTHFYVDWQGSSAGPDEGSGQAVPVEEEGNLFTQRKWENAARQSSRTREERRGIICIFRAEALESDSTQQHLILWSSSVSAWQGDSWPESTRHENKPNSEIKPLIAVQIIGIDQYQYQWNIWIELKFVKIYVYKEKHLLRIIWIYSRSSWHFLNLPDTSWIKFQKPRNFHGVCIFPGVGGSLFPLTQGVREGHLFSSLARNWQHWLHIQEIH